MIHINWRRFARRRNSPSTVSPGSKVNFSSRNVFVAEDKWTLPGSPELSILFANTTVFNICAFTFGLAKTTPLFPLYVSPASSHYLIYTQINELIAGDLIQLISLIYNITAFLFSRLKLICFNTSNDLWLHFLPFFLFCLLYHYKVQ